MPINLDKPLSQTPTTEEQTLLDSLQGNILSGHGREHTAHVFLRFDPARAAEARSFLAGLVLTSTEEQRNQARKAKAHEQTPHFLGCLLSHAGYVALGVASEDIPADPAFRAGMKNRQGFLKDPSSTSWEEVYQGEIHAMVLIGGSDNPPGQVDQALAALRASLPASVTELGVERGRVYRNKSGEGIEHFGYVDGRSQPLLREVDIQKEPRASGSSFVWDPAFPLQQVLVPETKGDTFGSYFVFRKLEQNVAGFKDEELSLGEELRKLNPSFDPELAGAMLVGRFEDGTPVALQSTEGQATVANDFDFKDDPQGLRCPVHAHVRKLNPRGESVKLGATVAQERAHIMARRGITYGDRTQNEDKEFTDRPSAGVGLLFMAFQSDLRNQFEFTQNAWADNPNFLDKDTGIDPVIGQGTGAQHLHRAGWGDASAKTLSRGFSGFVTLKGGEYFFAPSITFLASLKQGAG